MHGHGAVLGGERLGVRVRRERKARVARVRVRLRLRRGGVPPAQPARRHFLRVPLLALGRRRRDQHRGRGGASAAGGASGIRGGFAAAAAVRAPLRVPDVR
jgi:hypothetical protein